MFAPPAQSTNDRNTNFISESRVHSLILSSKIQEAKLLKNWLGKVIPLIKARDICKEIRYI